MAISDYIRKEKGQKSIKLPKLIARKKKPKEIRRKYWVAQQEKPFLQVKYDQIFIISQGST